MQIFSVYFCICLKDNQQKCKYFLHDFRSSCIFRFYFKNIFSIKINTKERCLIVSSSTKYDIFKNSILLDALKMTGYNLYGQLIYDTRVPKTVTEDKLEILFYKMRRILGKNDLVSKSFFFK